MKQDNAHITRIDRGWNRMQGILEKEMPVKKKERRRLIFWLLLGLLGIGLITGQFLSKNKLEEKKSNDVAQNESHESLAVDESKTDHISQKLVDSDKDTDEDAQLGDFSASAKTDLSAEPLTPVINKPSAESLQNQESLDAAKKNKIVKEASLNKKETKDIASQSISVKDISGSSSLKVSESLVTNTTASKYPVEEGNSESNVSSPKSVNPPTALLIELEDIQKIAHGLDYQRNINLISAISFDADPIIPAKQKNDFYVGISGHGLIAQPQDYKGWNAGLHFGMRKNKVTYSVFGRFGCMQRSLLAQSQFDIEPGTMEDDLTNMFDTMMIETILVEEDVSEKFYFIETGLSLDMNITGRLYLNLSPGIDFLFNHTTTVNGSRIAAGLSNPLQSSETFYSPTGIRQSVIPFISGGLNYRIAGGLFVNTYYKRQLSGGLERPSGNISLNQYNAGLKLEF